MDKRESYRNVIKSILNDLAALITEQHPKSRSGVECEYVFDDERGHYLLVKIGWVGTRRVRATTIHIRLRDERIWIEEDMTEEGIALELVAHDIPKEDIVLAFQSPETRKHTEFAVA
jgi:hypothetical protein